MIEIFSHKGSRVRDDFTDAELDTLHPILRDAVVALSKAQAAVLDGEKRLAAAKARKQELIAMEKVAVAAYERAHPKPSQKDEILAGRRARGY
jgi:hypothetical protein